MTFSAQQKSEQQDVVVKGSSLNSSRFFFSLSLSAVFVEFGVGGNLET
jgi:hypothetical protein